MSSMHCYDMRVRHNLPLVVCMYRNVRIDVLHDGDIYIYIQKHLQMDDVCTHITSSIPYIVLPLFSGQFTIPTVH